jgi:hypothetical protein
MPDQYIPDIYNYCDRWCERCTFTSRCAVGESEGNLSPEERDINNQAFWKKLAEGFREAMLLIQKAADEHGIDLTMTEEEEKEYHENKKRKRKEGREHPIGALSWNYAEAAQKWLEDNAVKENLDKLLQRVTLGIQTEEAGIRQVKAIEECLSVIQWYVHFIHVKFMRALMGKMGNDGWEIENGFQRDYDGSAKIALIAIDRSMQAWSLLYELIPDEEDPLLRLLAMLQKLKLLAETEFPDAQKFIRPGFDEI